MSDLTKINLKSKKINVIVNGKQTIDIIQPESKEDSLQQQLELQYEKGFNEGQYRTKIELEKQFNEKLIKEVEPFNSIATKLNQLLLEQEKNFEELVLYTAIKIARKIIKREIDKESNILSIVPEILQKVNGANNVVIKLNLKDYEVLNDNKKLLIDSKKYSKITFEPDATIQQGGCFLESEIGNVDARLSTQLEELESKLLNQNSVE